LSVCARTFCAPQAAAARCGRATCAAAAPDAKGTPVTKVPLIDAARARMYEATFAGVGAPEWNEATCLSNREVLPGVRVVTLEARGPLLRAWLCAALRCVCATHPGGRPWRWRALCVCAHASALFRVAPPRISCRRGPLTPRCADPPAAQVELSREIVPIRGAYVAVGRQAKVKARRQPVWHARTPPNRRHRWLR
jgi:hypothetical protein